MENWEIEHIAVRCRLALEARGYEVRVVQDFDAIPDIMEQLGGRCSPVLDPRKNLFTKKSALWIFAYLDGHPVIGGGARVDDLGREDLGSFIERSLPVTFGVRAERSAYRIFEGRVSGRVGYFGDLKATTSRALARGGSDLIRLYTTYGHYLVMKHLGADATYCYLRGVDKRRAESYGFLNTDPWIWKLDKKMYPDGNPKWIGHLSKERLPALMQSSLDLLLDFSSQDDQPFCSCHSADAEPRKDVSEPSVQGAGN